MKILNPVELGTKEGLSGEGADCGETVQRGGELREDRRLGDPLQSLDVPSGGHVEAAEKNEDDTQHQSWKNHPGSDGQDDSKDAEDIEPYLRGKKLGVDKMSVI